MSNDDQLFCPQCKTWFPKTSFSCLPLDLRCNKCIPQDAALKLYDDKLKFAGQQIGKLMDASDAGKGLKPLERMVDGIYDAWGGVNAFCQDAAEWCKDLAQKGRKGQALQFMAKVLAIHGKVDKLKIEDDWNKMTKEEIKQRLALKMAAILAESKLPGVKDQILRNLMDEKDGDEDGMATINNQ